MSTEIGIVADMDKAGIIDILQFSGGKERGVCIQLTIMSAPHDNQYILLDRMGVELMADLLVSWLEKNPDKSIRNRIEKVIRKIDTELDKPRY